MRIRRVHPITLAGTLATLLILGLSSRVGATPSSTFWTNCSIDIQSYKVVHITYDNYTTIGEDGPSNGGQQFANDLGLTAGILALLPISDGVGG